MGSDTDDTPVHVTCYAQRNYSGVMPTDRGSMLTPHDVAEELAVSARTVQRYIKAGLLPAIELERGYRVTREDLDDFLARRSTSAAVGTSA